MSVLRLRPLACGLLLSFFSSISSAFAAAPEPAVPEANAGQRAAAEALFNEGLGLLEQGKAGQACPKLEESQRLDAGVGTLLYLADCYRTLGRTASAWGTFLEAAYAARASHDEREAVALEQAKVLEAQLSYLTVQASAQAGVQMEIKQDGRLVGQGLWGTKIPVDPGEHTLEAHAPGYEPWWDKVVIPVGPAEQTQLVPVLVKLPELQAQEAVAPLVPASGVAPAQANPYQTAGWVLVGVGGAALVAGGVFALLAGSDDRAANGECRPDAPTLCNQRGVELADSARTKATVAGVGAAIGVAGIAGGVTLLLTSSGSSAPSPALEPASSQRRARVAVRAALSPSGAGLGLGGTW